MRMLLCLDIHNLPLVNLRTGHEEKKFYDDNYRRGPSRDKSKRNILEAITQNEWLDNVLVFLQKESEQRFQWQKEEAQPRQATQKEDAEHLKILEIGY